MQFPVPQFTDVEDKIIGPLTLKQFGIVFGVGIVIFLGYSATKSILVLVFLFVLFGVPGLGLAFAKVNGRPIYNSMGYYFKFLSSTKVLIFHKEVNSLNSSQNLKKAQLSTPPPEPTKTAQDTQANLREVQALLAKTASEERDVAGKLK
jgi:hypothetical protein